MDKMLFKKAQHIISPYLNKETRVMDLLCGENCYTKWIRNESNALLVPVSPSDMEHISHENPFVAYNNFVNDERKIPTDQSKADVVLLLGPLYDKQSEQNKRETLKEIKRLVSKDGNVITLRSSGTRKKGDPSPFEQEKENLDDAGFTVKEQQSLQENNVSSSEKSTYLGSEYYLTVATPKPVISCDALPPEVYVRTPVDVIQKHNITVLDDQNKEEENTENVKQEKHSHNKVKQSINPRLQKKVVVKNSIDRNLYVTKKAKEDKVVSFDLPILPKEIKEQYDNSPKENNVQNDNNGPGENNSNVEINSKEIKNNISEKEIKNIGDEGNNSQKELLEKNLEDITHRPPIPIKESIDKNLYVRKQNMDSGKIIDADMDYSKVQFSIDKSLQIRIPRIDPKYAKPKSRKKCIRNVLR